MISFREDQLDALRGEAFKIAADEKRGPDVSALVRDAVDEWLKRRK